VARILFLGYHPKSNAREARLVLDEAISKAGLKGKTLIKHLSKLPSIDSSQAFATNLKPSLIVAMGAPTAHSLVRDWPDRKSKRHFSRTGNVAKARDMENRRGYWWDEDQVFGDVPVLSVQHPADLIAWKEPSGIGRMLFEHDVERAAGVLENGLHREKRDVEVIWDMDDAQYVARHLLNIGFAAADIENDYDRLKCIGFAPNPYKAYVFAGRTISVAMDLLRESEMHTVWQNGQYDLHYVCGFKQWGQEDSASTPTSLQ